MRVIVMDRELHEPLTVVEVPQWLAERAKNGAAIHFAAQQPQMTYAQAAMLDVTERHMDIVTLTFEAVYRGPRAELLFWYAYADNPETALLLRAAFLPGQVGEVKRREREAYVRGLFMMPLA